MKQPRKIEKVLETDIRIMVLSHRIYARWMSASSKYDLTPPQVRMLKILAEEDNVPMTRFPQVMPCTKSNVTGVISSMVKKGLVTRRRDSTDRRMVRVKLTEKGRALAEKLPSLVELYCDSPTVKLTRAELEQLCSLMEKLQGGSS